MALPWLRLIDVALNVGDVVRRARARTAGEEPQALAEGLPVRSGIETRLAGVVVAALREAFDRDSRRLEFEREQMEAERQRAERALKLELLRQAGDREIARLRLIAGAGVVGWVGALMMVTRLLTTSGGRVMLGVGWALLLVAIACAFMEQSRIARSIAVADERLSVESSVAPSAAGLAAPWLVAAGFAAITIAALL